MAKTAILPTGFTDSEVAIFLTPQVMIVGSATQYGRLSNRMIGGRKDFNSPQTGEMVADLLVAVAFGDWKEARRYLDQIEREEHG